MKTIIFTMLFVFVASVVLANDVWINGYYRKDGTYVQDHTRSAPDHDRSNNYGPAYNNRDYDNDGIQNRYDRDDDNDGVEDNRDSKQYNSQRW